MIFIMPDGTTRTVPTLHHNVPRGGEKINLNDAQDYVVTDVIWAIHNGILTPGVRLSFNY